MIVCFFVEKYYEITSREDTHKQQYRRRQHSTKMMRQYLDATHLSLRFEKNENKK